MDYKQYHETVVEKFRNLSDEEFIELLNKIGVRCVHKDSLLASLGKLEITTEELYHVNLTVQRSIHQIQCSFENYISDLSYSQSGQTIVYDNNDIKEKIMELEVA